MRTKMYVRIAIIVCVLFVTLNSGTAAINTWTNSASGSWGTAINWDAGVPAGSDDISISQEGTYTVTVDDDTANNDLGMAVTSITVEANSGLPELAIDFTSAIIPDKKNLIAITCERTIYNEIGTGGLMGPVLIYQDQ